MTNTRGNRLKGGVRGADVQDRDKAPGLIEQSYPTITTLFADSGYACQSPGGGRAHRSADSRNHQAVRPDGLRRILASPEAWMVVSSIGRMTRRIAKIELAV